MYSRRDVIAMECIPWLVTLKDFELPDDGFD